MKLKVALEVYRTEGPDTTAGHAVDGGAPMATRVVHLHLTADEIRALLRAWERRETDGKGIFFQALTAAETRLRAGGYL